VRSKEHLSDAMVRNLTWSKAVKKIEKRHKERSEQRRLENARRNREGEPDKPELPPLKKPVQVSFIDTIERGCALILVIGYGGSKTFRALRYVNGKPKSVKIGTYPPMTVKEARTKARDYFENPQKFAAQAAVGSFKEIAENWIKRHVEAHGLRSHYAIKRMLARYVYPKWKDRPFLEIRRRDVNDLLDYVADNHGRSQADAVLATIRGIMIFHQSRDENYVSPIVKGMRRNRAKPRDRILNDNEIRHVWKAADDCGTFGALVKVLLLTAQRREKVTTMMWDDIADGEWTIRVEQREKGTAGKINLPQIALDVINAQPRIAGNPYVFAGRGKTAFNSFAQRKDELDEKLPKMPPWVLHDLRRTARSLMSRAGVSSDHAERVLGHAIAGIEGIYDRFHYSDEKAEALKQLAHLIETIINPPKGNVVAMPRNRRKKAA
jgi:integrase